MPCVEVEGLRVAFERTGAGPPVVLLHGGLADHREWSAQLELADEFTVVAWDAPGCGASADPPKSFRMPEYAGVLAALIEALGLERPHVVGLSFGATLALELYRRAPEIPRTMVLASAYAGWTGSLPPEVVAERLEAGLAYFDTDRSQPADGFLKSLFSEGVAAEPTDAVTATLAEARPRGARVMLRAMAECDLRDMLPSIDVPTLLLYGERDVRSPLSIGEQLHAAIRGSILTVLPGVGHQCNVEAPGSFTAEVRAFLRANHAL